ncbi:UNVERIFIED_CONTAM: hypothetical protein Scaly_1778600 [Sesamum calycinum]|uniref:Aminotransferase-like plant mobile domain-containing protein n=1 Tax=Sesamum calycinum TaxID=2727403 RepID=A0AAW2NWN1_9LAMI
MVKFWSKKTIKYHLSPPHKEKKTIRPKSTHNPLGDIAIQERWSTTEETLFAKLYIEKSLKKEAYLAAYLACWFCVFALPNKDVNSVRPSTFKMASLMASGRRVNLAIPVLASTYEGLNTVATSPKPTPWFPYLPTNAKKLCSETYKAWWAKVHGTFNDDNIACLISPKSIKITLKRKKNEDKQVDGGENNPPHALVPFVVVKCNSQAAVAEASKEKGTNESASQSSMADFVAEIENEVQSIDAGKESETSHSSTTTPLLGLGLKRKQSPHPATMSVFEGESFLFNHQKEFLQRNEERLVRHFEGQKQFSHDAQAKVHEVDEDVAAFENTTALNDAIVEDLEFSRANLEVLKEDLKSLNPFT